MSNSEHHRSDLPPTPTRSRRLPPWDSAITLEPGQQVTLDTSSGPEFDSKIRVFREIRGNILASCFSVEFALDRLISEVFYPGVETPGTRVFQDTQARELRDLFDDLFLKGNRSNFASKIQLLRSLRARSLRINGLIDSDLIRGLDQLRDLRNRFAHYPISFFPERGENGQVLVPKLVCRDKDLPLDKAFFEKADGDFRFVQEGLQEALTALRGETSDSNHS
jgi:hypothetical protein